MKRPFQRGQAYAVDGALLERIIGDIERLKAQVGGPRLGHPSPGIISISSTLDTPLERGHVVRVTAVHNLDIEGEDFNEDLFFKHTQYRAEIPRDDHKDDIHAILVGPLQALQPQGDPVHVKAVVSGMASALVDIKDEDHRYAKIVPDEHILESTAAPTSFRIVDTELEPGIRHARVLIGGGAGSWIIQGNNPSTIMPGQPGLIELVSWETNELLEPRTTEIVWYPIELSDQVISPNKRILAVATSPSRKFSVDVEASYVVISATCEDTADNMWMRMIP